MPEISIIVPVYNVGKYVGKCIDSILNQTFRDFELIMVDDGSTDNSGEICDKYKLKDNRIIVIHKENGGLSSARNVGIDNSTGNFLGFVDSDDYIEKDMYETLYNDIKEFDADIAVCQMYDKYGELCKPRRHFNMHKCALDSISALKAVLEMRVLTIHAVDKLYKKYLFEKVRFPIGKTYEDVFVTPILIFNSQKISYNPLPKYVYVHRDNSITMRPYGISDICIVEAYKYIFSFVKKNVPSLKELAYLRYLYSNATILDKMIVCDDLTDKNFLCQTLNLVRSNSFKILTSNCFSIKKKIKVFLLMISPNLYKLFLKFLDRKRSKC